MTRPTFQEQMPDSTRVVGIVYKLLGQRFGAFTSLVNPGYIWETLHTLLVKLYTHTNKSFFEKTALTNHKSHTKSPNSLLSHALCARPLWHSIISSSKMVTNVCPFQLLHSVLHFYLSISPLNQLIQKHSQLQIISSEVEPAHVECGTDYYWFCSSCFV